MTELISLFTVSFLAATILPAQSEIVLVAMNKLGETDALILVLVATIGNVLGSIVNWFLGRYLIHFKDRKWFPVKEKSLRHAENFYNRWGVWSLLLAWVPFIGDPLTLVAGIFHTNIWLFVLLVTIGKASRYIAVVFLI